MQALKIAGYIPSLFKSQFWDQIPYPTSNFSGQTVIVTGSNTGLGLEAARHIVRLDAAKVVLAVRTISKGEAAAADIVSSCNVPKTTVEAWQLDMSDMKSIKAFVKRAETLERLDAAILNAGVMSFELKMVEDLEYHMAVNVVGTLLLTELLLPVLQYSAQRTGQRGRLSIVGSDLMYIANLSELEASGKILEKINDPKQAQIAQRYRLSKLLVFWSLKELAERNSISPESNVILSVITPGACKSDLFRDSINLTLKGIANAVFGLVQRTTEVGGRTLVHSVSPELSDEVHGKFLMDARIGSDGWNVTSAQAQGLARIWNNEMFGKLEELK